ADYSSKAQFEWAELRRHGALLFRRQGLTAKQQHGMLVHAGVDGGNRRGRQGLAQVDSGHLAGEWMQRANRKAHEGSSAASVRPQAYLYWVSKNLLAAVRQNGGT